MACGVGRKFGLRVAREKAAGMRMSGRYGYRYRIQSSSIDNMIQDQVHLDHTAQFV